jgi:hypothetical protein
MLEYKVFLIFHALKEYLIFLAGSRFNVLSLKGKFIIKTNSLGVLPYEHYYFIIMVTGGNHHGRRFLELFIYIFSR